MFEIRMEITLQLSFVYARHCDIFLLRYNYVICLFDVVTFELRLEKLYNYVVFARHCDVILLRHNGIVLLRHNYVIYLFDVVTFFGDVRIALYFSTFELRTEITLQLRFVFARHCDVFLLRHNHVIYLFVVVTFLLVILTYFYYVTITLSICTL